MTKISFIGGGSVQWTTGLVNDMALTETLHGAELVLYDIDVEALKQMTPICKRIVHQHRSGIQVRASADRVETLRGADFVILCVGIGGLAAMRNDLEIPEKYGIYQAVGDTVGPGGWARGLRHIPFAVELARQMEDLCPNAWLLNLTNPMTTICRGISRATSIRTIGLCHEVTGFQQHMAGLFRVPAEKVELEVAGINHLPVITRFSVDGRDGESMLHDWLAEHSPFEFVKEGELQSVFEVFRDRLAVKLTLLEQLGVIFGAGDRHVAEFFPGFLTEANDWGRPYGVHLTTIDMRESMAQQRRANVESYVPASQISGEQLAPLMAALLGGSSGRFVVNIPNTGQIDNLPREAVVECVAQADELGLRPLASGPLSHAAYAAVAPHVARQELIVEAALSGNREAALAALATEPLLHEANAVKPLFDDLMAANVQAQQSMEKYLAGLDLKDAEAALAGVNDLQAIDDPAEQAYSIVGSTLKELLDHGPARAILLKHFPGMLEHPQLQMALGMTLKQVAPFAPEIITEQKLSLIEAELAAL